jgi:hypothetical protein
MLTLWEVLQLERSMLNGVFPLRRLVKVERTNLFAFLSLINAQDHLTVYFCSASTTSQRPLLESRYQSLVTRNS